MHDSINRLKRSSEGLSVESGCGKECREARKSFGRDYRRVQRHWMDTIGLFSDELKQWEKEIKAFEDEAKQLKAERDTIHRDCEQKQKKIGNQERQNEEIRTKLCGSEEKLKKAENQLSKLEADHKILVDDHNRCADVQRKLEEQIRKLQNQLAQKNLEQEMAEKNFTAKLLAQQEEFDQTKRQMEHLKLQANEMTEKYTEMEYQIQQMHMHSPSPKECDQCGQLEAQCKQLREAYQREMEKRLKTENMLNIEKGCNTDLMEEVEFLRTQKDTLSANLKNYGDKLETASKNLEASESKLSELQHELNGTEIELTKAGEREDALSKEIQRLSEQMFEFRKTEDITNINLTEFETETKLRLSDMMEKKRALDKAIADALEKATPQKPTQSIAVDTCERCPTIQQDLDRAHAREQHLVKELEEKTSTIASLNESLSHLINAMRIMEKQMPGMNGSANASMETDRQERVNECVSTSHNQRSTESPENHSSRADGRKRKIKVEMVEEEHTDASIKRTRI